LASDSIILSFLGAKFDQNCSTTTDFPIQEIEEEQGLLIDPQFLQVIESENIFCESNFVQIDLLNENSNFSSITEQR
jgi:hypothetical protein